MTFYVTFEFMKILKYDVKSIFKSTINVIYSIKQYIALKVV